MIDPRRCGARKEKDPMPRLTRSLTLLSACALLATAVIAAPPRPTAQDRWQLDVPRPARSETSRGLLFEPCDAAALAVTDSLSIDIVAGNSVVCWSGSGTAEHHYGRSHDLSSYSSTAGLALEATCAHFGLAAQAESSVGTITIYRDTDGMAGPQGGGGDLWPLGSTSVNLPATSTPLYVTGTFDPPIALLADDLLFIELTVPASALAQAHEVGSNSGGELSSSWLRTGGGECGIGSWITPGQIGYPNMHLVEVLELQESVVPDPCDDPLRACAEDVDDSGAVAVSDLLAIIANWGQCGDGTYRPVGDVAPAPNGDCCVGVADVLAVIAAWGEECGGGGGKFAINEIRVDQDGEDLDEFAEIAGPAGISLDEFYYLVIGDGAGGGGVIEEVVDLSGQVIAADGLFTFGEDTMTTGTPDMVVDGLNFENSDNVTHMLVQGFSGAEYDDLDIDDDGVLDVEPWEAIVDAVSLVEPDPDGGVGDPWYAQPLGPVGYWPPSHVYRCPDLDGEWRIGVYASLAIDSPGESNQPTCDLPDADGDGIADVVDNCYLFNPDQWDCNDNGTGDECDIADGVSQDCNANGVPDECDDDCNANGVPDECDIANGTSSDCDANGVPDDCQPDCNENGIADACDIANGDSSDDNANGIPDECETDVIAYTSFEEPSLGGQYVDTGDASVDHELVNNDGQAMVAWTASGAEMGFSAWYWNTRDDVGLTDGDWVGTTDYSGNVGEYPDGTQGYELSDCDGAMELRLDTVTTSGSWNIAMDVFVVETGWESEDSIVISAIVDGGAVVTLLDTTGTDIDDLGIEGAWFTLIEDLSAYTEATLSVRLDSNSGYEAVFVDNVRFSSAAFKDTDGDGVPDSIDNCYLYNPDQADCDGDGVGDVCEIADGTSDDCDGDGVPDDCQADCNGNGVADTCDIANGDSSDDNGNGIPDECEGGDASMVITAVFDGPLSGGTPKGVELYVLADIADLGAYGIGSANNGGGSDGVEFTFPSGSVAAGTFIYVSSEAENFAAYFGFAADYSSGAMSINGDDAVELFNGTAVIDVFGDINADGNGTKWEYLDGWAYRLGGVAPNGGTFGVGDFTYSGPGALDGCTTNGSCTSIIPVGTWLP